MQRLTEPLHLNLISLFVAAFGSFRAKVNHDLVVRQQYAFSILHAADKARANGILQLTVIELGVAKGAGLMNMCKIAERVSRTTGVQIHVIGFDTGVGMPPAVDYRDHPELWQEGDFAMDREKLEHALPPFARLIIGDIRETIPRFLPTVQQDAPIGFVAVDVDYYSSAKVALDILKSDPQKYLPTVTVYLDDIGSEYANPWCGELLAVNEFNDENELRKISPFSLLHPNRVFKHALWIDRIFTAHVFDHPIRSGHDGRERKKAPGRNEYL
ncbi:MAG: hypothetical protein ACT4QB_04340 [Gammaproteobacteria bacterium]